jgi:N-acetylglucosaminyldiphosphoundecaprenol N-acetyl-beta-D-mannosaminyltransferase
MLWAECERRISERQPGFIVTPNLDHMVMYRENPAFREVYAKAMFRTPDSTPVMWLARLLGMPLAEKLAGSDLVPRISERAAACGYSVFLLGAAPGVAERAGKILAQRFPGFRLAGTYCPPLGFQDDPQERAALLAALKEAQPDICYVALGAPKQEFWMAATASEGAWCIALGIGAGLDFISGERKRAPVVLQKLGLEWFWRTVQEPLRLGPRYWNDAAKLAPAVLRALWKRFTGRG